MASQWNFTIYDGSDFEATLTITKDGIPVDLTGYSAKMEFRAQPNSTVLLTFSLGNELLITGGTGEIHIFKPAAGTTGLVSVFSSAQHDLRLVAPDGKVPPPAVAGTVNVVKVITQP